MDYEQYVKRCEAVHSNPSKVAKESKVSPTTISRWKAGTCEPAYDSMQRLEGRLAVLESVPNPEKMVYTATDNAMLFSGIPKGASLTLKTNTTPKDGDICLIMLDDTFYLRKMCVHGEVIFDVGTADKKKGHTTISIKDNSLHHCVPVLTQAQGYIICIYYRKKRLP